MGPTLHGNSIKLVKSFKTLRFPAARAHSDFDLNMHADFRIKYNFQTKVESGGWGH